MALKSVYLASPLIALWHLALAIVIWGQYGMEKWDYKHYWVQVDINIIYGFYAI
jgi:hypothetical protein